MERVLLDFGGAGREGEGYKTWKSLSQWVYSEEHNQAQNNLKSIF